MCDDLVKRPDEELIMLALEFWACHIETGKITLNARDAERMGKKVKALTEDQMRLIIRLRDLKSKQLTDFL